MSTPVTSLSLLTLIALASTGCATDGAVATTGGSADPDIAGPELDEPGLELDEGTDEEDSEPAGATCSDGIPVVVHESPGLITSLGELGEGGLCLIDTMTCTPAMTPERTFGVAFDDDYLVQIDVDHPDNRDVALAVFDEGGDPALEGNSITFRAQASADYQLQLTCQGEDDPLTYSLSLIVGVPQDIQEF